MNKAVCILAWSLIGFATSLHSEDIRPSEITQDLLPIVNFYQRQNITGSGGKLLENVLLMQRINAVGEKKNETTTVLLFAKSPKKCLVYFLDKTGIPTAYLQRGTDTWIFRTSIRNPLKVTTSQSILGEANVGDILGLNLLDDFSLSGVEKDDAATVYRFDRVAPNYPYPAVTVSVDNASERITSIEYQGLGGKSIRTASLDNYSRISGDHEIPVWTLRNLHINTDVTTTITYTGIRRIDIPDSFFQPDSNSLNQFIIWAKGFL